MEIDLPTTQILSIVSLGFATGAIVLHYFLKRPLAFFFAFGILFFVFRLIPTVLSFESASPTIQEGGLVSEMVMWCIYTGSMLLGYFVVKARLGKAGSTNESVVPKGM